MTAVHYMLQKYSESRSVLQLCTIHSASWGAVCPFAHHVYRHDHQETQGPYVHIISYPRPSGCDPYKYSDPMFLCLKFFVCASLTQVDFPSPTSLCYESTVFLLAISLLFLLYKILHMKNLSMACCQFHFISSLMSTHTTSISCYSAYFIQMSRLNRLKHGINVDFCFVTPWLSALPFT